MYVTNNIGSPLKVVRVYEKIASLMVGKCKHYVRECATAGAGSCIRLCESRFLLLEYSVEYLIEYSSTRQGKLVSKSIYIRRQKARVTRHRVRHTAYSRYLGYTTVWPGTVPELICIVPAKAKFVPILCGKRLRKPVL